MRLVKVTDETWERLRQLAHDERLTMGQVVASRVGGGQFAAGVPTDALALLREAAPVTAGQAATEAVPEPVGASVGAPAPGRRAGLPDRRATPTGQPERRKRPSPDDPCTRAGCGHLRRQHDPKRCYAMGCACGDFR